MFVPPCVTEERHYCPTLMCRLLGPSATRLAAKDRELNPLLYTLRTFFFGQVYYPVIPRILCEIVSHLWEYEKQTCITLKSVCMKIGYPHVPWFITISPLKLPIHGVSRVSENARLGRCQMATTCWAPLGCVSSSQENDVI